MDHFVETAKNQFTVIENEIGDDGVHIDAHEEAVFKGILYAQIFGHQGNLWFQKSPLSDYAISNRHFLSTLDSYSKEGLTVKKMVVEGQKAIEIQKMVGGRRMLVGFSLSPVQELLFIQTLTLIAIALLTVASVAVIVAAIGHIVSDPVCKLAIEAAQMAAGESVAQTLSLSNRKDEVGLLATELNNLLSTINKQQKEITVHKVEAELGRVATQVAHDIRGPLSSMQAALGYFVSDHLRPSYN